jgi:hypothetical protein
MKSADISNKGYIGGVKLGKIGDPKTFELG